MTEIQEVRSQILSAIDDGIKNRIKPVEEKLSELHAKLSRNGFGACDPPGSGSNDSLARRIAQAEEFKTFTSQRVPKGKTTIFLGDIWESKAVITNASLGSNVVQRVQEITPGPVRRLRLRDILTARPTSANSIEYLRESAFTNNASTQTEGSAKGESEITFTTENVPIRTIAHWCAATRQVLDDVEQLEAFIESRLRYGLQLYEETQILLGDGLGSHLTGIATEAGAYLGTYNAASDNRLDKIRHAALELEAADELPPTAVVVHPRTLHDIRGLKEETNGTNTGSYIYASPSGAVLVPTAWGLPIVATNALGQNQFLIGNFTSGAVLWDRQTTTLDISTEHSDFFTSNKLALRLESRLAVVTYRPTSFLLGTF